ncbi:MAG: class I SAM-dependent methyltransferase [Elusimicrobia bacterium]|nr:class I SAM-dependent methyltransferase [Elusimicrobiota bacterium]
MTYSRRDNKFAGRYNFLGSAPGEDAPACAELLRVSQGDRLIEFGCGNGDFLAAALGTVDSAVGVDISANRLAQAALRFKGDARVELIKSALLDFDPGQRTFTKGLSRKTLRLLTDKEKNRFFGKIGASFSPGALFLIEDLVLDFERAELDINRPGLMKDCAAYYGASWERRKKEVTAWFKQEYPEGIKAWTAALQAGGFGIIRRIRKTPFYGSLLAERQ